MSSIGRMVETSSGWLAINEDLQILLPYIMQLLNHQPNLKIHFQFHDSVAKETLTDHGSSSISLFTTVLLRTWSILGDGMWAGSRYFRGGDISESDDARVVSRKRFCLDFSVIRQNWLLIVRHNLFKIPFLKILQKYKPEEKGDGDKDALKIGWFPTSSSLSLLHNENCKKLLFTWKFEFLFPWWFKSFLIWKRWIYLNFRHCHFL